MTRYRGPSEAQSNAEALGRRDTPYSAASGASFTARWDFHRREPRDLREAAAQLRRAYADEVPTKLHDTALADDGTPRMTAKAEGYIFGSPHADDAGKAEVRPLVSHYHTPFRATLARLEAGPHGAQARAAIVRHVAMGGQGPQQAAVSEGVPPWCAKLVSEDVLRAFLRSMTDLKLTLPKEATNG